IWYLTKCSKRTLDKHHQDKQQNQSSRKSRFIGKNGRDPIYRVHLAIYRVRGAVRFIGRKGWDPIYRIRLAIYCVRGAGLWLWVGLGLGLEPSTYPFAQWPERSRSGNQQADKVACRGIRIQGGDRASCV